MPILVVAGTKDQFDYYAKNFNWGAEHVYATDRCAGYPQGTKYIIVGTPTEHATRIEWVLKQRGYVLDWDEEPKDD